MAQILWGCCNTSLAVRVCLLAICLCSSIPAAAQPDLEDQMLAEMCRRGLGESAVQVAAAYRDHSTDSDLRAKWTMRLMEAHALAALNNDTTADQHWSTATKIYQQFASEQTDHRRSPWLTWQAARCELLHAQSLLAKYLAAPANTVPREAALASVREVMSISETLADDIKRRQPIAARQGRGEAGNQASAEELAQLSVDTALLQCEALLVRAQCYAAGSPDRVAAVTDVATRAAEVVTRTSDDWAMREQLTIAQAVAAMELGNGPVALKVLTKLASDASDPRVRIRAAMLAIENLAANRQTSQAQPLLAYLENAGAGPELALAQLQLSLADLPSASNEATQRELAELLDKAKAVGRQYGDYWRNRAEALLVGSVSSSSMVNSGVGLDLLLVEVRQLLASNDTSKAVGKLLQFRDNEATAGNARSALQLGKYASALLGREKKWREAIAALEPIVLKFSQSDEAAETHLLVIEAHTQALRADPNSKEQAASYEASLKRQLQMWPDAIASDAPQEWLTRWLVGQQRHKDLLVILQERIANTTQPTIARHALHIWLQHVLQLAEVDEQQMHIASLHAAATDFKDADIALSSQVASLVAEVFSNWSMSERAQILAKDLERLQSSSLDAVDQQLVLAALWLNAIRQSELTRAPRLTSGWEPSTLPGGLRSSLSGSFIEALDEAPTNEQPQWIARLSVDANWLKELEDSSSPLLHAYGLRLSTWSNGMRGLEALERLASENKQNADIQLQLAQALASIDSKRLEESSRIASKLATNTPAASEVNRRARWLTVKNAKRNGNAASAEQSAALLLATLPEEESVWRQRLESFLNHGVQ
ncbi:MAG: hypothetical protein R3C53_23665 [Pirellulaceae bacterium]